MTPPVSRLKHFRVTTSVRVAAGLTLRLSVSVRGTHGRPVVHARVYVDSRQLGVRRSFSRLTGRHGVAFFKAIHAQRPGNLVVTVRKRGWSPVGVTVVIE